MYLSVTSLLQVAAVLLIKPLSKRFSKIAIYRGTALVSIAALVCAYFFGKTSLLFTIFLALNNFSMVIAGSMSNAFITDIADYNEFVRGMGTRGFTVSLSGTANTFASLIGGALASFSLVLIGYDADAAATPEIANRIRFIVTLGTAVMTLVSLIPFLFYKLNDKKMKQVYVLKNKSLGIQNDVLDKKIDLTP
jgi:Na+/melibiose symporter-like transporter